MSDEEEVLMVDESGSIPDEEEPVHAKNRMENSPRSNPSGRMRQKAHPVEDAQEEDDQFQDDEPTQERTKQKVKSGRNRSSPMREDTEEELEETQSNWQSSKPTARILGELERLRHEKNLKIQTLLDGIEQKDCEIYNLNMVVENLNEKLALKDKLIARQLREIQSVSLEFNRFERDQMNLTQKIELYEDKFVLFEKRIQEQVEEIEERERTIERLKETHAQDMELIQSLTESLKKSALENEEKKRRIWDLSSEKNVLLGLKETSLQNLTKSLQGIEALQKELMRKDIKINEVEMQHDQLYSDKRALEATLEEKEKLLMEMLNKYESTGTEAQGLRLSKVDQSNELVALREKFEQMRNQMVETMQTNTEVTHKLNAREREIMRLEDSKRKLEVRVEHLEKETKNFENDLSSNNEKFGKTTTKLQIEYSNRVVLEQEIATKNIELDRLRTDVSSLRVECGLKSKELESLVGRVEKLQSEIKKLEVERRCAEDELVLAQKDIFLKSKASGSAFAESETAKTKFNQISKENEMLLRKIEQLEKEKEDLVNECLLLTSRLNGQSEEAILWKKEAEMRVVEAGQLSSGKALSTSALRDSQFTVEALNERVREANSEMERLREKTSQMKKELEERTKQKNEAENDLKALVRSYSALERELKEKSAKLKSLSEEHEELLLKYSRTGKELRSQKAEMDGLNGKLEQESQTYKGLLAQREKKADEWHKLYMESMEQINKMRTEKGSSIPGVIRSSQLLSSLSKSSLGAQESWMNSSSLDYSSLSEEETLTLLQDYKNKMSRMQRDMQELAMRLGVENPTPNQAEESIKLLSS